MASPSPDLDIEAQTNNSTETWPEINLESPPSVNPQLSTTPEPPVQHTSTSQHHYENAARKITDNSRVELVMPRLGSAQLSSAKHGSTKMGRAKPSHS